MKNAWMWLLCAAGLAVAGCRDRGQETVFEERADVGTESHENEMALDPQSGDDFITYRVEKIDGGDVVLRKIGGQGGDIDLQSGGELRLSRDDLQRMANHVPMEGSIVLVKMGANGKPESIRAADDTQSAQTPRPMPEGNMDDEQRNRPGGKL